MIKLCSMRTMDPSFDNWLIVRSLRDTPPAYGRQVSVLSPSRDLFYKYLRLKDVGLWDSNAFRTIYVPRFIDELIASDAAQSHLAYLVFYGGKRDITLTCFCTDERYCHRSIVGGILLGMGANIQCNPEYHKYYDYYIERGGKHATR